MSFPITRALNLSRFPVPKRYFFLKDDSPIAILSTTWIWFDRDVAQKVNYVNCCNTFHSRVRTRASASETINVLFVSTFLWAPDFTYGTMTSTWNVRMLVQRLQGWDAPPDGPWCQSARTSMWDFPTPPSPPPTCPPPRSPVGRSGYCSYYLSFLLPMV